MIEFVEANNNKNLILFVHGFTGDVSTWLNKDYGAFPDLLLEIDEIKDNFDVAHFTYYTKLLNLLSKASNASKLIKKMFRFSHDKLKRNISIDEISTYFRLKFVLSYKNTTTLCCRS